MDINDIYAAAIENDEEKLIDLLKKGEVDLNELIDFGVFDGTHSQGPLLYSMLCYMNENGLNFSILDILIKYGADVDRCIELKSDTFFFEVPILLYAIVDWKSQKILEYLLSRGANPNSQKHEHYTDGSIAHLSMVYFAIDKKERVLLDILLKYGADPNAQASIDYLPTGFHQVGVPLFYAQDDTTMCVSLLNYGADINARISPGTAHETNIKFSKHFKNSKPSKYHPLFYAIKKANTRLYPTIVNKNDFILPEYRSETKKSADFTVKNASPEEQLKQKIGELVHFDIRNKGSYLHSTSSIFEGLLAFKIVGALILIAFLALSIWSIYNNVVVLNAHPGTLNILTVVAIVIIFICAFALSLRTGLTKLNEAKGRQNIRSARKKLVKEINELEAASNARISCRWWNNYDGLAFKKSRTNMILTHVPFSRIRREENELKIVQLCTATDTIKGDMLSKFTVSKSFQTIYRQEISPEQTYKLAELCLWYTSDGMTIDYKHSKRSEKQVKSEMQKFGQKLDEREQFKNAWENGVLLTDDERALAGMMSEEDYLESLYKRRERSEEFEQELRKEVFTEKVISGANLFCETFYPSGIIAFDENDKIVAICLYLDEKKVESYDVDGYKRIRRIYKQDLSLKADRHDILEKLKFYPTEPVDVLSGKPDDFSEEEWVELIYSSFTHADNFSLINSQIKSMRVSVDTAKQKQLNSR